MIIIRTGWLCCAELELAAHFAIGLRNGIKGEEIDFIIEGPNSPNWNLTEATLLQAVDEIHKNLFLSNETWIKLSGIYDEQQFMSLIIVAARYHHIAMQNNSIGIQLEEKSEGFGPLSEKLNQIEWVQQFYQDQKNGKMIYRSKIKEIDT